MAAAFCLAFPSVTSSKPKLLHHAGSLNHRQASTRILSMVHFQDRDSTSSSPVSVPHTEKPEVARRISVDFPPDIWGSHFISSSKSLKPETQTEKMIEEHKEKVKSMLSAAIGDPSEQLILIDKIQKLGVAYHFEAEIDQALQDIKGNSTAHDDGDLETVALRFRLLRQAGHFVSPGVFNRFIDKKGEFHESLRSDLEGLLSLYEAAHLGCMEESILDNAIAFTTEHLNALATQLNDAATSQVKRSLHLPLHKRLYRVEIPYYISVYENVEGSENDVLLHLAKLDYNALQSLQQTELNQLSRWGKELDLLTKLPFRPRDRTVEGYVLVMTMIPEPQYSTGRIYLSKLFYLCTIIDDLFDAYGTIEELQPITDAISRWDTNELPEFVVPTVMAMYNVFSEIEEEMAIRGLDYTVPYFKRETQQYVRCLLDEAKVFDSKKVPPLEEWLQRASITIGVAFLTVGLSLAQWDHVTKEVMEWCISDAKIHNSSGRCGRLQDDIHTFKFEQERDNMASSITCYMKEHGVDEDEAVKNIKKMILQGWREMNEECLKPSSVPFRFLMIPLNIIRLAEFLFFYGKDGYYNPKDHKGLIASLIVNPLPI